MNIFKNILINNGSYTIMEEWKSCDFDTRYKISNFGNIKRVFCNGREKMVKPSILNKNKTHSYYYIQTQKEGKRKNHLIHRLVALAFCDNHSDINNICDHIDRNTYNNHYTNLKWGTQKDNMNNTITNIPLEQRNKSFKIKCECGRIICRRDLARHLRSKLHQRILSL